VKNLEFYPDNNVKIYNSNGILVFTEENYKGTWDGTKTGGTFKLTTGTYYFVININSGEAIIKGYLTLFN
jgi:gliding motility-associated-like protein